MLKISIVLPGNVFTMVLSYIITAFFIIETKLRFSVIENPCTIATKIASWTCNFKLMYRLLSTFQFCENFSVLQSSPNNRF